MVGNENCGEDEDDYMADLSVFLPPQEIVSSSSSFCRKKPHVKTQTLQIPKPKKPNCLSWQERRKFERETKQKEEDERTLAGIQSAIPESNIGFKMLKNMGYSPGSALGKNGIGLAEPVGLEIRRLREGLGAKEEKKRTEIIKEEKKRKNENELLEDFGSRKKSEWKCKRVTWDYKKAEATLAQLENREVVEPKKEDCDVEKEEEEEEVITEENLHNILMNLRDVHLYCLYCGCQYESEEALESSCPGIYEDDH